MLTDPQGRLCIYELMAEESAVNYWEVHLRCQNSLLPSYLNFPALEIWSSSV